MGAISHRFDVQKEIPLRLSRALPVSTTRQKCFSVFFSPALSQCLSFFSRLYRALDSQLSRSEQQAWLCLSTKCLSYNSNGTGLSHCSCKLPIVKARHSHAFFFIISLFVSIPLNPLSFALIPRVSQGKTSPLYDKLYQLKQPLAIFM